MLHHWTWSVGSCCWLLVDAFNDAHQNQLQSKPQSLLLVEPVVASNGSPILDISNAAALPLSG